MDGKTPAAEGVAEAAGVDPEGPAGTADGVAFSAPAHQSPVDLSDILRRLGTKVDFSDDRPDSGGPEASPPGQRPQPSDRSRPASTSASAPAAPSQEEVDEESINDYMSRLMGRVRAGSAASEAAPAQRTMEAPRGAPPGKPVPPGDAASVSTAPGSPMPQEHRRELVTLVARTTAPETHSGLSALRELANFSARNAMSRHTRRVLVGQMYSKLMVVAVSVGAAVWLLWAWKSLMSWEATYYAALVAVLTAVYWGVQYALVTGRLIVNKAGYVKLNSAHAKRAEGGNEKGADGETGGGTSAEQASATESAATTAASTETSADEASRARRGSAAAAGHFGRTPANLEGLLGPDATPPGTAEGDGADGAAQ
jgi:hypothetical protein